MRFLDRVTALPRLGLGVSTEYGAGDDTTGLDVRALRDQHPRYAGFLEIGVEVVKGIDGHAEAWLARGLPTTYHYLDVNLDEDEDFDDEWLGGMRALVERVRPAWLCGDAGLWHLGPRERGNMLLLPPILTDDSAHDLAAGVVRLRESMGLEVLPENPPGAVYLGDLHLLDFFARVVERADTGVLLDCAHLAIFQRTRGHAPLTALDGFPLDRVVELHVAGGTERTTNGHRWIEDSHTPDVLADTWSIIEHVVARAPNLKAIVFECERNPLADCLPAFARLAGIWS